MLNSKIEFPIFRLTIAMVWSNLTTLYVFITSIVTSSIDFGVFVYVVGSLDPFAYDPSSYTITLPNSNSNGNPFVGFGLLSGTYSSVGLNSSKAGCVATLFVYNSVVCKPSCVYYCCCKCWKCFGLPIVATPLWPSVGVKPNTSKVGDLESSGTPECLEFDSKAQNTSHWGVLGVIGKVLEA
jgi:hypothetical protein